MRGRKRDTSTYAAYKGDEFIDLGTLDELAIKLDIKRNTVVWLKSSAGQKRAEKLYNSLYIFKIDESGERV